MYNAGALLSSKSSWRIRQQNSTASCIWHCAQLAWWNKEMMTAAVWTTHLAFASFWVAISRQSVTITRNTLAKTGASTLSIVTRRTALHRTSTLNWQHLLYWN